MLSSTLLTLASISLFVFSSSAATPQSNNPQPKPDSIITEISSSKRDTVHLTRIFQQLASPGLKDSIYDKVILYFIEATKNIGWANGTAKGNDLAGSRFYNRGNFDKASIFFKNNVQLNESKKIPLTYLANAHKMLAGIHFNTGKSDSAVNYAELAIELYKQAKDTQSLARTINLLGGIYWNTGKLDLASDKLYEALKLREKIGDSIGVAHAYNNIGLIYDSQGKQKEALEMYHKALDIYQIKNDMLGIGRACNNIATVLKNQKRYNESLEMFLKSYEIDLQRNNIDDQAKTLNNIGLLYLELNKPKEAIEYFTKSQTLFKQNNNENGLAAVFINLGKAYTLYGDLAKAKNSYTLSLNLSQKVKSLEWERDAHQGLYTIYKKQGYYEKAITHFEHFKSIDDSLRSLSNLNMLDKLKVEYETEKKEHEISLLQKDRELTRLSMNRQKTLNLFLMSLTLSILFILTLSVIYSKRLKSDKNLLQQMNAEILIQKEEIEAQRDMLEINFNELTQHKTELQAQAEQIELQNRKLEYSNHRMTESLQYASLIQKSLMPNPKELEKLFGQSAFLYLPKDIVGGDLYWHHELPDGIIFTIADCTGHGVAGAFMSIMAISLLKDAVSIFGFTTPHEIAAHLYNGLLKNSNSFDSNLSIGIDFLVCKFTLNTKKLEYAGNRLGFVHFTKESEMVLVKPIRTMDEKSKELMFQTQHVKLSSGDKLFFYTDGYMDQLSDIKRKKIGKAEFLNLLKQSIALPLEEQLSYLEQFHCKWKGNFEQVDDIMVLGIQV